MAIKLKILSHEANRAIRLFLLAFFLLLNNDLQADNRNDADLQKAFDQFLNFELDSCAQSLSRMPRTPMSFYLETLLSSTKVFISDNLEDFKSNQKVEERQLKLLKKLQFDNKTYDFLRSEIKLRWAIIKLKNGEEFSAFWNLKQAYSIAKDNLNKFPEFIPSYKTIGLLHIIFGVLPDKYDWILYLFGVKGDVDQGLSELGHVSSSNHFLNLEAELSISLIHAYLLNNPDISENSITKIYQRNKHLLLDYAYSLILLKNSKSESALDILNGSLSSFENPLNIVQCYYLLGEIYLHKSQSNAAIEFYHKFLQLHTAKNLVKDTYYKIAVCHRIGGNHSEAKIYFEKCKQVEWAKNEADKYAETALESVPSKNVDLIRARYSTDGGYYDKAFDYLEGINLAELSDKDRCEYYYRKARLFHKKELIEEAEQFYLRTIETQTENNWYFAPNAVLQLGLMSIAKGNNEVAAEYLKSINRYRNYPYQKSIQRKAKIAQKKLL